MSDPALRAQMGETSKQRVRRFDVREATRRIEKVYTELLT